jgi:hypothetical protein
MIRGGLAIVAMRQLPRERMRGFFELIRGFFKDGDGDAF